MDWYEEITFIQNTLDSLQSLLVIYKLNNEEQINLNKYKGLISMIENMQRFQRSIFYSFIRPYFEGFNLEIQQKYKIYYDVIKEFNNGFFLLQEKEEFFIFKYNYFSQKEDIIGTAINFKRQEEKIKEKVISIVELIKKNEGIYNNVLNNDVIKEISNNYNKSLSHKKKINLYHNVDNGCYVIRVFISINFLGEINFPLYEEINMNIIDLKKIIYEKLESICGEM